MLENNLELMASKGITSVIIDFSGFDSYVDDSTINRLKSILSRKGLSIEKVIR